MVALEYFLTKQLTELAKVDGHDIGSGEINIFIFTDIPLEVFSVINIILLPRYKKILRAAYRESTGKEYVILWPPNLKYFQIA